MEKKVLMSIMTKYSNKIFNGTKKWEFRKNLPKINSDDHLKIVVYSSKQEKAIIGEFTSGRILHCSFDELMEITGNSNDEKALTWFKEYYKNKDVCCAIEVIKPIKYSYPITLDDITKLNPVFRAPQNFVYIKENDPIDLLIKKYNKR